MIKNKIDYKLINCALIMAIIFLLYKTGGLWLGIISKIFGILLPFIIAFAIAYALEPLVEFLTEHKFPKGVAVFIIILLFIAIIGVFGFVVVPLLFNQLGSLFNGIIKFINEVSFDLDLNVVNLKETLTNSFDQIIDSMSSYISSGAINAISTSIALLSKVFITFAACIYMLIDMDSFRSKVKKYLKKTSKKMYKYVVILDEEMHNYLSGFAKIMIISLFEYTLCYTVIGHPNAILLGCLAMVANLIPYFGGMINNTVAAITAFVISPSLFIKTIILFVILSIVDGNVINPIVYGKTNKIHPLVVIMSVFAGGALFGILGIVISLPCAIIFIATIKYFKEDVLDKIEDIKESRVEN
ncbi:MAG: AI-2E family transporter [Bacilli bacterium]|nr:AI-2E family transporter [Bacilli bacterium]